MCLLALGSGARAQGPTAPPRPYTDQPPINVAPPVPPLATQQVPSPAAPTKTTTPARQPAPGPSAPAVVLPGKLVSTPQAPPTTTGVTRTMYYQKPAESGGVRQVQNVAQADPKGPAPRPKESLEMKGVLDDLQRYQIRLEPPGPELVFRLDSEAALEQRMRQEAKQQNMMDAVVFPPLPVLSKVEFQGRSFPQQVVYAEPRYVNYRRLLFEEKNAERYGWDLGIAQPLISGLYFCKDTLLVPWKLVSYPLRRFESSAGECLPGDPVPYICYPPEFTAEGVLAELGVGAALFLIFP